MYLFSQQYIQLQPESKDATASSENMFPTTQQAASAQLPPLPTPATVASTSTTPPIPPPATNQHRHARPSDDFSVDSWGGNMIATHATAELVRDDLTGLYSCPKHPELCMSDQHTSSNSVCSGCEAEFAAERAALHTKHEALKQQLQLQDETDDLKQSLQQWKPTGSSSIDAAESQDVASSASAGQPNSHGASLNTGILGQDQDQESNQQQNQIQQNGKTTTNESPDGNGGNGNANGSNNNDNNDNNNRGNMGTSIPTATNPLPPLHLSQGSSPPMSQQQQHSQQPQQQQSQPQFQQPQQESQQQQPSNTFAFSGSPPPYQQQQNMQQQNLMQQNMQQQQHPMRNNMQQQQHNNLQQQQNMQSHHRVDSIDALAMQMNRMQQMQDRMLLQKEQECLQLRQKLEESQVQKNAAVTETVMLKEKLHQQEQRMQHELRLIKMAVLQQRQHQKQQQLNAQKLNAHQQNQNQQHISKSGSGGGNNSGTASGNGSGNSSGNPPTVVSLNPHEFELQQEQEQQQREQEREREQQQAEQQEQAVAAAAVASSTYGEDRQKVTRQDILDPYGDKGRYTGILLRSTGMPHGPGFMEYEEDGRTYEGDWRHGRYVTFGM
jgi:hypothetical protein